MLFIDSSESSVADTVWTKYKSCCPLQRLGYCTRYWALRWQRHSEKNAISI